MYPALGCGRAQKSVGWKNGATFLESQHLRCALSIRMDVNHPVFHDVPNIYVPMLVERRIGISWNRISNGLVFVTTRVRMSGNLLDSIAANR